MVNTLTGKGDMVDGGQVEGRARAGRVSENHRDWWKNSFT
jgi:hypothetical protein